jgi:hypothetical protein
MSRCAEAEQSYALAVIYARYAQASKANDSGAQQGRGMKIVKLCREWKNKIRASECILGVSAIHGISGERGVIAQILPPAPAIRAATIHAAHPGNADTRPLR